MIIRRFKIKRIVVIFILINIITSLYSQNKKNKIEMGSCATYFFDDRELQFGSVLSPLFPINTVSYSKRLNNDLEWQVKLSIFSTSRKDDYINKKITFDSYSENYVYLNFSLLKPIFNFNNNIVYIAPGVILRGGSENYFVIFSSFDVMTGNRTSDDIGASLGLRLKTSTFHNFYLFFQPQYNYYFIQQDNNFLKKEITGSLGIGYQFEKKK